MTAETRYPLVFQPFDIAGVTVRNRIFLPGHTTNFAEDFLPTERHVDYLRERAAGGVGLIIVEPLRVHRSSLGRSGGLSGSDRRAVDGLKAITDAVKAEGAHVFVQITHTGRHGDNFVDRLPPWGPSAVPWIAGGDIPHAMTRKDMDAVLEAFVETAEIAADAGFEGAEIHLGHGHLLHQFLSPASNIRDDAFGGSFENRMRYPLEVLQTVIAEVGSRLPIGIRVSVDDLMEGGCDEKASFEITRQAAAVPGVAFVNASVAAYSWPSIGHHVADMSYPAHPFLDQTVRLREAIGDLPLLTANRYTSLAEAEEGLATGAIDLIGMNRAHMADPQLIVKTRAGREADIRPCVSNNFCIGQIAFHRPISCMMNPRVGKEKAWPLVPEPALQPKSVLVIGGGPAGLEAACVAAERGHDVTLWEAAGQLGGALNLAGTCHGRADLHRMRDYLERRLRQTNAAIHLDRRADIAAIVEQGADVVVLATGTVAQPSAIPGSGGLMPIEAALAYDPDHWVGRKVCIVDLSGSWASLSAAETLAERGASVTVVTRPDSPFWDVNIYSRMTALERLAKLGVELLPGTSPRRIDGGTMILDNKYSAAGSRIEGLDTILVSSRGVGAHRMQVELEAQGIDVRPVGDALTPHSLFEAVHDGHAVGRAI